MLLSALDYLAWRGGGEYGEGMELTYRRIYSDHRRGSEYRVLVDRLWPRGVSKEDADVDLWAKDLTPTSELRSWYHEDKEARYDEFVKKYRDELEKGQADLAEFAGHDSIVLLTAVKDVETSHVPVLLDYLETRLKG